MRCAVKFGTRMARAALLVLLCASVMFGGNLQAQRGGVGGRGGFGSGRFGSAFGRRSPGLRLHNRRFQNNRGDIFYPFWDDEPFWYDEPFAYDESYYNDQQNEDTAASLPTPVMILQAGDSRPIRKEVPVPVAPRMIELPGTVDSAASKPLPSTVFIFKNGERLEVRRYLLSHNLLTVSGDHQQRTIPLSTLDLDATIAANRERGIQLRVPADRGEISLSF